MRRMRRTISNKVDPPKAPVRLKKFRKEETKTIENILNTGEHRFKVNIHNVSSLVLQ